MPPCKMIIQPQICWVQFSSEGPIVVRASADPNLSDKEQGDVQFGVALWHEAHS